QHFAFIFHQQEYPVRTYAPSTEGRNVLTTMVQSALARTITNTILNGQSWENVTGILHG
ncbi:hypothetical protein SK128_001749, partial [Halocaridina rubra]